MLLGRPCQYDHRATHDGRSNTFSFEGAGRRCILRPMFANAIKDDIFSVQKRVSKDTTKPRTASFQGGGDDVAASARDNLRNVLQECSFSSEVPPSELKKDEVKPTFKTPCAT